MKRVLFIILTVSVFIAGGCKKEPPGQQTETTKKAEMKQAAAPSEPQKLEEHGYEYDPKGRRDPFTPLVVITKEKEKREKAEGLEGYDIGDFKLIAIAEKKGRYYGLLLAPDNKAYTIKEGATLGLHKGKVKRIMSNKAIVTEYIKDYKGELKPREIVLELLKKEG
ncbi:MAG: pilus assembly protein PilP [Nitrospirae bacterium]|nr:pilus assembly protein PilP [Nitrospirota bacterium]